MPDEGESDVDATMRLVEEMGASVTSQFVSYRVQVKEKGSRVTLLAV